MNGAFHLPATTLINGSQLYDTIEIHCRCSGGDAEGNADGITAPTLCPVGGGGCGVSDTYCKLSDVCTLDDASVVDAAMMAVMVPGRGEIERPACITGVAGRCFLRQQRSGVC